MALRRSTRGMSQTPPSTVFQDKPHFEFGIVLSLSGTHTMNDCNEDLAQTDEDGVLRDDVSDEAVEVASVGRGGLPTLLYGTYCFACPSRCGIESRDTRFDVYATAKEHR